MTNANSKMRRASRGRFLRFPIVILHSCFLTVFSAPLAAGEFDLAIASATQRVVKLYGLGAGVQVGYGSGILVSDDGMILTVLSLLIDARRLRVVLPDGTRREAEVIHRDSQQQLALLKLRPPVHELAAPDAKAGQPGDKEPVASGGSTGALRPGSFLYFDLHDGRPVSNVPDEAARAEAGGSLSPGDWVIAAGNAFKVAEGAEPVSVAHGVFSALTRLDARRRVRDYPYRGEILMIDAVTSNPGAPGAAVVNLNGWLVGMVGRDVISNLTHTHFNYAIPRETLEESLREALTKPETQPSDSGVPREVADPSQSEMPSHVTSTIVSSAPVDYGIRISRAGYQTVLPFVERVRADSPAGRAGLRADDLILSVNGKSVADVSELDARIKDLSPGEPLDLVVRRDRRILTIRVETK